MTDIAWRWRWLELASELMVSQGVADVLGKYRQEGYGKEQGGQLFVNPTSQGGLLLALATPPHDADRSGWSWLELDPKRCQQEIYNANAQGLRLIGYWHTHPQVVPTISSMDVRSFSRFAARYTQDLPHPIAIIVGTSSKPEGIKAWSFRDDTYLEATWSR